MLFSKMTAPFYINIVVYEHFSPCLFLCVLLLSDPFGQGYPSEYEVICHWLYMLLQYAHMCKDQKKTSQVLTSHSALVLWDRVFHLALNLEVDW